MYWLYSEVNFLIRLIESLIKHVHCILFIYVLITSAVLTHGNAGQLAGGSTSIGAHAIICMLCTACFLMFKHWFCCKYQYNKYIFFRHLQFYSCEWLPSALLFPEAYNDVKTTLLIISFTFNVTLGQWCTLQSNWSTLCLHDLCVVKILFVNVLSSLILVSCLSWLSWSFPALQYCTMLTPAFESNSMMPCLASCYLQLCQDI